MGAARRLLILSLRMVAGRRYWIAPLLPLTWVAAALPVMLIGGFLLGMWWVDHRMRKRHGGIRIY